MESEGVAFVQGDGLSGGFESLLAVAESEISERQVVMDPAGVWQRGAVSEGAAEIGNRVAWPTGLVGEDPAIQARLPQAGVELQRAAIGAEGLIRPSQRVEGQPAVIVARRCGWLECEAGAKRADRFLETA